MILVTGATGTTGSEVVRQLLERGERVRAMSRGDVEIPGVEVERADFDDADSLARAVDGVSAVYLVTTPPKPITDHDAAMVEAAKTADVERLVKLSAISGGEPGTWHGRAEQVTRDSGLGWTILRPATFASNMLAYAPMIRDGAPLPNPTANGAVGVIDPRDIAGVAVEALTTSDQLGKEYTLTGPELLTFPQQAAVLELVLGTKIETEDASMEHIRTIMLSNGMELDNVEQSIAGMTRQAEGKYALLTDHVSKILGHTPISFTTWANDHQHAFR